MVKKIKRENLVIFLNKKDIKIYVKNGWSLCENVLCLSSVFLKFLLAENYLSFFIYKKVSHWNC